MANLALSENKAYVANTEGGDENDILSESMVLEEEVKEDIIDF